LEVFIMPRTDSDIVGNSEYSRTLSLKFGDMMGAGFTVLPNILLKYQADLEITGNELNFIAQIWYHWWSDKDAYPAMKTIAKRMGAKDDETVRRYSRSLQKKGYLVVRDRLSKGKGQLSSEYDFSPLIQKLNELYLEEEAAKAEEPGDWVVRERQATPSAKTRRGGTAKTRRAPSAEMRTEEDEIENKTQLEEDPTKSFELQSQIFKTETRSKFSKKSNEKIQKSEIKKLAEPAEPSRGSSDFSHVSHILPGRGVRAPAKNPPDASRNGSESVYYPSAGTQSQPAPETVSNRPRGKPKKYPVPPDLERFTTDITAEFHDASKLKSNLTFIGRVLQETGLHPNLLYQLMHEARQLTKGRGDIEKPSVDDPGFRNRWPYFRSTLLDLVEKEGRPVSARRRPRSGSP
jgi:hypothetical protein